MRVNAYAALAPGADLTLYEYDAGEPGPLEVDVEVTHCGVCHTDLMVIDNDWGAGVPVVAGHEVAGIVRAVGTLVDTGRLAVGQRVVVGGVAGSCMSCQYCVTGRQQLCASRDSTAFRGDRGGFASSVRASDWRFAYPLPEAIELLHAGPLLCGGVTVYAPFIRHSIKPTDHVGIVGIGGLGHLAIQFARAWGCEVTAISSSPDKRNDALELGADHFITTRGTHELAMASGTLDFIISTVSADIPWDDYLAALKPQGTLITVGVPESAMQLSALSLVFSEKRIAGGLVASPGETMQMLDFAARTGVRPQVDVFPMPNINEAIGRVRSGDVRYRAVVAAQ
ncbi:NAD(P)-dependent alcohol dehydrogenase [Mycolicibacterium baixiangningiae]|uniref:NAD(P)-dependent alcohol dehydrogenase n=1 Tax=Mycolicibacterium baixiangningiae TaxID=2761578 RepID=UPI001866D0A9|nr:NAD(P)-dependent alcohol dehydrogenase [Mycolicibacterium baixiangningiae]